MRSEKSKYVTLILGLLVAVTIIFSQSYSLSKAEAKTKAKIEDQQESSDSEEHSSATFSVTTLPAGPTLSLTQEAICLFEVIFFQPESQENHDHVYPPLSKFFSTILSVFISPNAP